jgi:hypothetical protein
MLSDEEYRLLRQNIFERLASGTAVPTETPVIPLSSQSRSLHEGKSTEFIHHLLSGLSAIHRTASHPNPELYSPYQFQVNPRRTPSVRSKSSVTSAMSNLFKRGSRRISGTSTLDSAISESSTSPLGSSAFSPFKRRVIPPDKRSVSLALRPESRADYSIHAVSRRASLAWQRFLPFDLSEYAAARHSSSFLFPNS